MELGPEKGKNSRIERRRQCALTPSGEHKAIVRCALGVIGVVFSAIPSRVIQSFKSIEK
jgi:hypothetical protein